MMLTDINIDGTGLHLLLWFYERWVVVNVNDTDVEEEEVDEKDGLMREKNGLFAFVNEGKTITQL